jgi:hypothetical protein
MIIRFIGHMCHYTTAKSAHAVMFAVPDHIVKLRVQEKYTDLSTGDPEWVHCWKIEKSIVKFTSTGATSTAYDLTGLLPVPSLSLLGGAGGKVHADVLTPDPKGDFNAFVELPHGDYGIEDWYLHKATFNTGKSFVCVPRTITFNAPSTNIWKITGIANPPILTEDAVITITNLELNATTVSHYHYHGRLFDPKITPANPMLPSTNPPRCGDGTKDGYVPLCENDGQQDLSVECSNSRYP